MINDAFVFDCVAHPFNFDPKNAYGNAGLMFDIVRHRNRRQRTTRTSRYDVCFKFRQVQ